MLCYLQEILDRLRKTMTTIIVRINSTYMTMVTQLKNDTTEIKVMIYDSRIVTALIQNHIGGIQVALILNN